MIENIHKYVRITVTSVAVIAILVVAHLVLDSWGLSSDGGIYKRHGEQSLQKMRPTNKPQENVLLPSDVSNQVLKQFNTWRIQDERQRRVSQICKARLNKNLFPELPLTDYIKGWIVDRAHGVAFRGAAKVGSTSWTYLMASVMSGISANDVPFKDIKSLRNSLRRTRAQLEWNISTIDDFTSALRPYKTFVFVRHPLSRLLSAYIGKMTREEYKQIYGDQIRKFSANNHTDSDTNLTFRDFVRYIIATRNQAQYFDVHWKPLTLSLQPCQFQYDFIGHLETTEDDSEYIFQNLFHNSSFTLPRENLAMMRIGSRTYTKSIREYYNELTAEELVDIIDVYKYDFDVFGYEKIVPVTQ